LNPVKAGLVKTPEAWAHSDYRDWIGLSKGTLYKNELRDKFFKNGLEYKEFVRDLSADVQDKNILKFKLD
jgi:hypothetical protein